MFRMLPALIFSLLAGFSPLIAIAQVDASAPECRDIDWTTIQRPEEAVCFGSIESAFQRLPEVVKPYFVFMRDTRSAQPSTLKNPRVIMVSPNGTFLVGASTMPDLEKRDLEVAVYDQAKSQWNFAGIDFSTKPPTVETESCKSCHGAKPHPIWGAYGAWKGAYARNNFMKAEEADFLNRVAAKEADVPELLKSLVLRKSYKKGERIHPKGKTWGGEEASQLLNYVAMQKAAQTTVAEMLAKPEIRARDLLRMSAEISCGTKAGALEAFGYSVEKNLYFGLEGKDPPSDQFNGLFNASVYLAVELVVRAMDLDERLKARLPDAARQAADERYGYFRSRTLDEFVSWQKSSGASIRNVMSDYLFGRFYASLQGSAHCNAVREITD